MKHPLSGQLISIVLCVAGVIMGLMATYAWHDINYPLFYVSIGFLVVGLLGNLFCSLARVRQKKEELQERISRLERKTGIK